MLRAEEPTAKLLAKPHESCCYTTAAVEQNEEEQNGYVDKTSQTGQINRYTTTNQKARKSWKRKEKKRKNLRACSEQTNERRNKIFKSSGQHADTERKSNHSIGRTHS